LKLSSLLAGIGVHPVQTDAEVLNITDNIKKAGNGTLFVCRPYEEINARDALNRGSCAVISEEKTDTPGVYYTENVRLAFSRLCALFYGNPDKKLKLIGVTGTNGKTTTAFYIRHILESLGNKCALIGTLGADVGEGSADTGYTTPPPDVFFEALYGAVKQGQGYCVCEVSSQALAQRRVDGAGFTLGVFTNIGADHLDYHKTVSRLVEAKTHLCSLSDEMLINADDAYSGEFLEAAKEKRSYIYSCRSVLGDFTAKNIKLREDGSDFILFNGTTPQKTRIETPGLFSVYNALSAAGACMVLGADIRDVAELMPSLPAVPGRSSMIDKNGVRVCVDFAHTPDALSAIISAIKLSKKGRLITVFGCGGDRDKLKRPLMGDIASRSSDEVILTSDNPRSEDPLEIISDIKAGIRRKSCCFAEPDRGRAIRLALNKARPGDTVLIAGKGHENYQIIGEEKIHFSDIEEVLSY